jgi:hypothetical protein
MTAPRFHAERLAKSTQRAETSDAAGTRASPRVFQDPRELQSATRVVIVAMVSWRVFSVCLHYPVMESWAPRLMSWPKLLGATRWLGPDSLGRLAQAKSLKSGHPRDAGGTLAGPPR